MAMIHVNRGATSLGTFSDEEVREGLRAGRFLSTDLGWREGMPSWKQLSQFAEFAGESPTSAAAPEPPPGSTAPVPVPVGPGPPSQVAAPRSALPWEQR